MKKTYYILILCICFLVLIISVGVVTIYNREMDSSALEIGSFNLSDYLWEVETFRTRKNVGEINNVETAIACADELWNEKWGIVQGKPYDYNPANQIEVLFDSESNCWLIKVTIPEHYTVKGWSGALPRAILSSDGKLVVVWMG